MASPDTFFSPRRFPSSSSPHPPTRWRRFEPLRQSWKRWQGQTGCPRRPQPERLRRKGESSFIPFIIFASFNFSSRDRNFRFSNFALARFFLRWNFKGSHREFFNHYFPQQLVWSPCGSINNSCSLLLRHLMRRFLCLTDLNRGLKAWAHSK